MKFTCSIILLIISINVKAQYQLQWVKALTDSVSYSHAESMILDTSGNVFVNGFMDTASTIKSALFSYDSMGTERFRTVPDFLELAFTWRLFKLDNKIISAGHYEDQSGTNNMFYTEFNANGDSVTGGIFNSPGFASPDDFSDACVDSRGNVYLAGLMKDGSDMVAGICRYDTGGNFRWSSTFSNLPGWNTGYVRAAELTGDSGIYLWTFNFSGVGSLLYYDSAGVFKWQTELPLQVNECHAAFAVDKNGNAIIGGSKNNKCGLAKTNLTGDTIWTVQFTHPYNGGATGDITNVLTDTAGNIYVLGTGNSAGSYGIVAGISSTGQLLWSDTITGGSLLNKNKENFYLNNNVLTVVNSNFNSVLYQYDLSGNRLTNMILSIPDFPSPEVSDIIFTGQSMYLCGLQRDGSSRIGYVAKFNSTINTIDQIESNHFLLYPNPVLDDILIKGISNSYYKIINSSGQVILDGYQVGNLINVSRIRPGNYFLVFPGKQHYAFKFLRN